MARPTIDLASLSFKELQELEAEIASALVERARLDRTELRQKLTDLAAASGFTIDEVFGGKRGRAGAPKGSAPIKFRNPDNPSETWSGRGRRAMWLADKLKKRGAKIEDFAV